MPLALILALSASLVFHAAILFGTAFERSVEPATPPLMAELKPTPRPAPLAAVAAKQVAAKRESAVAASGLAGKSPKPRQRVTVPRPPASASPVLSVPAESAFSLPPAGEPAPAASAAEPAASVPLAAVPQAQAAHAEPAVARLPAHGMIRYRVDRGDSNFEIGYAQQEWTVADGQYRLTSVAETTGLVWLFKSVYIEMESSGRLTAAGLQPQTFAVRRKGLPTTETADFDWDAMTVRVGGRGEQPLDDGAQDLLSFNYQLGYLPLAEGRNALPVATGKKYEVYRLDVLGDENLELPVGPMRTLHLRAPGTNNANSTELWLAYDYLLLPVKIRYVDARGDSFVQVATKILVGEEPGKTRAEERGLDPKAEHEDLPPHG